MKLIRKISLCSRNFFLLLSYKDERVFCYREKKKFCPKVALKWGGEKQNTENLSVIKEVIENLWRISLVVQGLRLWAFTAGGLG